MYSLDSFQKRQADGLGEHRNLKKPCKKRETELLMLLLHANKYIRL